MVSAQQPIAAPTNVSTSNSWTRIGNYNVLYVRVSYTNPSDSTITRNVVRYRTSGSGGSWTQSGADNPGNTITLFFSNDSPLFRHGVGGTFEYQVAAGTDNTWGNFSSLDTFIVAVAPPAPAKPTITGGDGEVTLSASVVYNGGTDITKWQYTYKTDGDYGSWNDVSNTTNSLSHTVTGLTNGTAHKFKVRAVNGVNAGGSSESDSITPADFRPTFTPTTVSVTEGGTASYKVKLPVEPYSDVKVTVSRKSGSDQDSDLSVKTGSSLTFTTTNWNTYQTVTLQAADDDDGDDGSADFEHTTSGGGYGSVTAELTATESDNDTKAFTFSKTAVEVKEDSTATYTLKLATKPSSNVTVTVRRSTWSSQDTDLTVDTDTGMPGNQSTLTFTSTNWSTAQTVTLAAAEDDDGDDGSADIEHSASGGGYNSVIGEVEATESDNDTKAFTFSKTAVDVTEDSTATYTVKLATKPSSNVTVTVARKTGNDQDSDLSVKTGSSLTFTTSNWNTAQTVTLQAAEDEDGENGTAVIEHRASGGGYNSVTAELTATEDDNDTKGLTFSSSSVTVPEGSTASYTVKLATRPTGNVTVSVARKSGSDQDSDLSVKTGSSLTFSATNWNTAQTVTLEAAEDGDDVNGTAVIEHRANGGGYDSVTAELTATEDDNDAVGLVLSTLILSVSENGEASYKVKLANQPSSDVVVTVARKSGNGQDTSLSVKTGSSLTFTTSNWNTAQTVTLQAAEDGDGENGTAVIEHRANGGGYNSVTAELTATERDNDAAAITLSITTLTVRENGEASYDVKLATRPSSDVIVTVARKRGNGQDSDLTVDTDPGTYGNQSTLTFTSSNWSTAQTVTLAAADDDDGDDDSADFEHTATGGGYDSVTAKLTATESDNDTKGFTFTPTSVTVTEGSTATYTMKMHTKPSGNVVVTVRKASGGDEDITVDTAIDTAGNQDSLTFTTGNWDTARTVTVSAEWDLDSSAGTAVLEHSATGGGYDYVIMDDVSVSEIEVERMVSLSLSPSALSEGSSQTVVTLTASLSRGDDGTPITLGVDKAVEVTLGKRGDSAAAGADYVPVKTFDVVIPAGQSAHAVEITFTPVDDTLVEGAETITITGASEGLSVHGTTLILVDDEPASEDVMVILTASPSSVREDAVSTEVTLTASLYWADEAVAFPSGIPLTLTVGTSDDEAVSGTDYAAIESFDVTIPAERSAHAFTITLLPAADALVEGDETITIRGASAGLTVHPAVVTLLDDGHPAFDAGVVVSDQKYVRGSAIPPFALPVATGGDGDIRYTLDPSPPDGLRFDAGTRTLTGVPLAVSAEAIYTYTATDEDGDEASLSFKIEVIDGLLSALSLSEGRLVPAFSGDVLNYEAEVGNMVETIGVSATSNDPAVMIMVDGVSPPGDTQSTPVTLEPGRNVIEIAVTGRVYTVVVTRRENTAPSPPVLENQVATAGTRFHYVFDAVEDANEGQMVTYAATVDGGASLPGWLTFDARARAFSGTPSREDAGKVPIAVTATDDGFPPMAGRAVFVIEVTSAGPDPDVVKMTLAVFGRTVGADAVDVITSRFSFARSGVSRSTLGGLPLRVDRDDDGIVGLLFGAAKVAGLEVDLPPFEGPKDGGGTTLRSLRGAGVLRTGEAYAGIDGREERRPDGLRFRRRSARDILSQSRFDVSLGPREASARPGSGWALWGQGRSRAFSGRPDGSLSVDDGRVYSAYLGIDYRDRNALTFGLSVSRSVGYVEYVSPGGDAGEMDLTLNSLMPYIHYSSGSGTSVWGLGSVGRGEMQAGSDGDIRTDIGMVMGALGLRDDLVRLGSLGLSLKGDAFVARLESDEREHMAGAEAEIRRVRILFAGEVEASLSANNVFSQSIEVGGRWDGGDAENGPGAELRGTMGLLNHTVGLGLEASGHYLLAHRQNDFEEWGAGLMFRIDPGMRERGLQVTMAPMWGSPLRAGSGTWDHQRTDLAFAASSYQSPEARGSWRPRQLDVRIGYGLEIARGGVLTSYGGIDRTGVDAISYLLGGRLELGRSLSVNLEGEHRREAAGSSGSVVRLRGRLIW